MISENSIETPTGADAACVPAPNSWAFSQIALRTKRLLLRPLQSSDALPLLALFSDQNFMQFVVASPWESVEEAYAMINRDVAALAADERVRLGIERV